MATAVVKTAIVDLGKAASANIGKTGLSLATKTAAKEVVETGVKTGVKESIETGVKTGVKEVVKEGTETITKEIIVIETKQGALAASKSFITKNAGKLFAAGTAAFVAAQALDAFNKKNNKAYNIISITVTSGIFSDGYTLNVQYNSNGDKLNKDDTFTLSGTNSVPSTDGTYTIISSTNSGNTGTVTAVSTKSSLTTNGSAGTLTYQTTFASQLGSTIGQDVGSVSKGIAPAVSATVDNLFDSLGLSKYQTPILIFIGLMIFMALWNHFISPILKFTGISKYGGLSNSKFYNSIIDL